MQIINDKLQFSDSYINHKVFGEIDAMRSFYDSVSDTCMYFPKSGTRGIMNYATYIYMSMGGTLESIQMLLQKGRINDAYVLVRKLLDDAMVDIYIEVKRREEYHFISNPTVEEVNNWLQKKIRVPKTEVILKLLRTSKYTKDLYPFFGWDTYLKTNRQYLDDSVHENSYRRMLWNCNTICLDNREKHLDGISVLLSQILRVHLSFIFYLNDVYLMSSDYLDAMEVGMEPTENSENWIAPFALQAYQKYIKPYKGLNEFIVAHTHLDLNDA